MLPAWLPILRQYGPALIVRCQLAAALSEELVSAWLAEYMMPGDPEKAKAIAAYLAKHENGILYFKVCQSLTETA